MNPSRHASSPLPSPWQTDPTFALGFDWDDTLGDERQAIRAAAKHVLSEALGDNATPTDISTVIDLWFEAMAKHWQSIPETARLDRHWGFSAHEVVAGRMTMKGQELVRGWARPTRDYVVANAERILVRALQDAGYGVKDIDSELGTAVMQQAPQLLNAIRQVCNDPRNGIEVMVPDMAALLTVIRDHMPGVVPLIGTNGDAEIQTTKIADASMRNAGLLDDIAVFTSGQMNIDAAKPDHRMLQMMMQHLRLPGSIRILAFVDNRLDTGVKAAVRGHYLGQQLGVEVLPVWFDSGGIGLEKLSTDERRQLLDDKVAVVRSPKELLRYVDQGLEMSKQHAMNPIALQQSFFPTPELSPL